MTFLVTIRKNRTEAAGSPISEAIMDRIIHNSYEVLIDIIAPGKESGRPATEKEQGVRYKQIHMKSAFDDGSQRINSEAEVCVTTDDVDTGKVTVISIFKHGTPP